ncbi:NAD-P-binding protein [Lactifluus volemus]|nr:NAD-P-binding protein [Lactifluus volemus]
MSGYKNFAIIGAGDLGMYVVRQFLEEKAAGTIDEVVVLTRQESNRIIEGDARVVPVDYSSRDSIRDALIGIDVVICTISGAVIDLQRVIIEAAKEAGVQLFLPSEFGGATEGKTEGVFGEKADIQRLLIDLDLPYAAFYTGPFADGLWQSYLYLDVTSGHVSVGGDGNTGISFTSRTDIARYLAYVLTHLPPEELKNRSFAIEGDAMSFNEVFQAYEAKTGKKLQVTYIPLSKFEARLAANQRDIPAFLHIFWATEGPFPQTDNDLYPDWNPSPVIDNVPVA